MSAPAPWPPVRRVLAFTVPLHALLPVVLWLVHRDVGTTAWTLLGLHGAGLVAIVASVRWWWGRAPELLLVLVADHAATFVVGSLLVR